MGNAMSARALLLALCVAACASPSLKPASPFVDAATRVPGLVVEMRYASNENFVGRRIDGYEAARCLLTPPAADALSHVQSALAPQGLGLKVLDCYRPKRAVAHFARWARDPADEVRKADYYPNVDKAQLFALGYIAEQSGHSRGSTVDVTLVEVASGRELDMGSPYDLFDTLSWPGDPRPSGEQRVRRLRLQAAMQAQGFAPIKEEWWHFTLRDEPWPDTYFDLPVR
jgi:zinc D-Ala-D-Ala dipeptidase